MANRNRDLLASKAWKETSLGPMESWSPEMRALIDTIMASEFPIGTTWGSDDVQVYNDAYNPIYGDKHPAAFGTPLRESWTEIWDFVGPAFTEVRSSGRSCTRSKMFMPLDKGKGPEETYFDFCYSPITAADGAVIGVMSIAIDQSADVIARRRRALSEITADPNAPAGLAAIVESLRGVLEKNELDCAAGVLFRVAPESGLPVSPVWTIRTDALFVDTMRPAVARAMRNGHEGALDIPEALRGENLAAQGLVLPVADRAGTIEGVLLLVPHRHVPLGPNLTSFAARLSMQVHRALSSSELRAEELQRTRERMEQGSAMYRFLFDQMVDGAIYTTAGKSPKDDRIVLAMNERALEMLGYTAEEVVGMRSDDLYFSEDAALERAIETRTSEGYFVGDLTVRRRDGTQLEVEVTSNVVEFDDDEIRAITIIRDRAKLAAREREQEVRAQTDAMARLTRAVAHDFNNLLTVILGSMDLLEESIPREQPEHDLIRNAIQAAERASNLTSQLLAYSRPGSAEPHIIDPAAFLEEIHPLLEAALGDANTVELRLNCEAPYCWADPSALTSALINLLSNARHAMPEGGTVTIGIATRQTDTLVPAHDGYILPAGQYVVINVEDEGTGIPDDIRDRLFEPFFTTKEVGEGTGIGLPIVLDTMRRAGGDLRVAPSGYIGAKFKLILPMADQVVLPKTKEARRYTAQGERILYVEDNALVREQTTTMLESLGFCPIVANHGRDALEKIRSGTKVDIVLTDLVMPGGISGRQLALEIEKDMPEVPVVITTGYDPEYRSEGQDSRTILRKPYSEAQLGEVLLRELEEVQSE